MAKRKKTAPVSEYDQFRLMMTIAPSGVCVLGTAGKSFAVFESPAAAVAYLRRTADQLERNPVGKSAEGSK